MGKSLADEPENMPAGAWRGSSADANSLAGELSARIQGEVRFDEGRRALYSTDSSNSRQLPSGVVVPYDVHDIIETVALCRR